MRMPEKLFIATTAYAILDTAIITTAAIFLWNTGRPLHEIAWFCLASTAFAILPLRYWLDSYYRDRAESSPVITPPQSIVGAIRYMPSNGLSHLRRHSDPPTRNYAMRGLFNRISEDSPDRELSS